MPQRNTTGGKGYKKTKKGLGTNDADGGNLRFSAKKDGQDYGRVTRLLGNRRVMCSADDIFEDVNGSEGEGEGQGEVKDQDTNVETPVSDRNAVVVSKKEKTKQIHGCLDNEDLVIDDI